MRPLPSTTIVPRTACSAAWIVTVSVRGAGVSNDSEGPVVGRAIAGLRSTMDGDGAVAGLFPPQAEASKQRAVAHRTIHRWVRLKQWIGLVCIQRLRIYRGRYRQYNKVSARLDWNRLGRSRHPRSRLRNGAGLESRALSCTTVEGTDKAALASVKQVSAAWLAALPWHVANPQRER